MRSVNIAHLKNNLSRYLREVRRGEEILIRDRKVPIARITPLDALDDLDAEERALIAAGRLRPPRKRMPRDFWEKFWALPAPRVPLKVLVDAVVAGREED